MIWLSMFCCDEQAVEKLSEERRTDVITSRDWTKQSSLV